MSNPDKASFAFDRERYTETLLCEIAGAVCVRLKALLR
jgi:hypothetical protein